ncbi:cytochrome c-type biogenesis protein CcmF [Cyclonatronum proteinivorum]|uniref:Cytochrome c-type biogenesis protein CcmF n=1 Tax=Cyclonatronum proteinivorum TaxID=1457365 RepID=A0A345ULZ7_9BACT|nr:cytochrome c biogenesis protein CcsA [Cyclonatronum proteinivorum]AXJ01499.1 cytochrome c-type biogenesis protein CcmF [Cyclonatronum proteinivorum]
MIGTIGSLSVIFAFLASLGAFVFYFFAAQKENKSLERTAHLLFGFHGAMMFLGSALLVYLLLTNQFQYFYVYNYTSSDLSNAYLWAAFYSGQEGSFMLWILSSFLVGLGLIRWTSDTYRAPVMFFMTLTHVFLTSMIIGVTVFGVHIGASPFRLTATEFAHLPVFINNPAFIPAEGSGLNDLLRSPWIIIHPPIIFLGFAMMAIPFAYALASLWKRKYHEWIYPAFPWTLGANLCLLVAIFLGGYWAYETLSFGGYWAWDPVENASLVPWILGTAGIHTMLIQKRSKIAHKASIIFAILAYVTIVYQTFLTRSGILGDSSVHSFVDLGLYNQLLFFILAVSLCGLILYLLRMRELPSPKNETPFFSREFFMFSGAMTLLLVSLVIILGTSAPIIGRLFVANPTPPQPQFYNDWTLPFAIAIAFLTVLTQYLWWNKFKDTESFAGVLITPTVSASVITVALIVVSGVTNILYMVYLFAAVFAIVGNGMIMFKLVKLHPKMIGGSVTHIGFAVLLIGFLGAAYDTPLLDRSTINYNAAVERGEIYDEDGFRVYQTMDVMKLDINVPKRVGDRYDVTFTHADITHDNRPGEQRYRIEFKDLRNGRTFTVNPVVYPMIANSSAGNMSWTVDPEVRMGLLRDIYVYVSGSSLVERENNRIEHQTTFQAVADILMNGYEQSLQSDIDNLIRLAPGSTRQLGQYSVRFERFINMSESELPENAIVGVRARLEITNLQTRQQMTVEPKYAILFEDGINSVLSPAVELEDFNFEVVFETIDTRTDEAHFRLVGIEELIEDEWIIVAIERKPLVSVVWLGTFLLMFGFSIAIYRRWDDQRKNFKRTQRLKKEQAGTDKKVASND